MSLQDAQKLLASATDSHLLKTLSVKEREYKLSALFRLLLQIHSTIRNICRNNTNASFSNVDACTMGFGGQQGMREQGRVR